MVEAVIAQPAPVAADLPSQLGGGEQVKIDQPKPVDFIPVQLTPGEKQKMEDRLVVPPDNIQFVSEVVSLSRAITEFKTKELVNKTDDPKDPDAPRIIATRVVIARPYGNMVVVGRHRDAGVALLASPATPLFREPTLGDLIMARPGYLHLAANLTAADRRAAFTVEIGANKWNLDGKRPCVAVLRTDVAKPGKDKAKDNNFASCVAPFLRADQIKTWDIKVVEEALVKATTTATVQASVFQDAADRLPVLSGKKADDKKADDKKADGKKAVSKKVESKKAGRVTIQAKDNALFLTNGDSRVVSGCTVTTTAGGASVQVDIDDLNRVVKGIASQMLTGPVIIAIDPTGIVKFDFTTKVGQFSFLIPTMNRDGRNSRHFAEFNPIPWAPAATPAAN